METISSVDGTQIAYERTGSGPPLVLVHGTSADHTRWEIVRSPLEEHATVYAIDRRGRGESGDSPDYALEREFEDVAAVVDSIGEPVILLGHSYGALCSLEAALRTDNLSKLILYEPPFPVGDSFPDTADVVSEMKALYEDDAAEDALVLFFTEVARVPPMELDALRAAPNWPNRVAAVNTVIREVLAPTQYEFDASRFEDLTVPTLLLSGSESAPFLKDAVETLRVVFPNNRVVVFDGHAHAVMNTAPDRFVDEVLVFIQEPS
ncbi:MULTISPECIES: alpha/beta fold hydrolase [Haloferax]|uniref:Alpha/beta fold hydrolase n=2 Tax=Haloferax TaxID=2251 RepID=A0A6G1Z2D7_9EURY|nr:MULTISPECIES: alpha/beta hydrolase [Haloferax]KAB1187933.1 alpha/beta hydrolase [Haloferax sp. CBA1149]MRW80598.1 alpha/beta fold hydrolase [Haloferax marinisediminis]